MGDLRAGTGGTSAAQPTGKRVARHSAERVTDQPYIGRRVAAAPGRRRVEPDSVPSPPPSVFSEAPTVGRHALRSLDDVWLAPAVGQAVGLQPLAPVPVHSVPAAPVPAAPVTVAPVAVAPVAVAPVAVAPVTVGPVPVASTPLVLEPAVAESIAPAPEVAEPITLEQTPTPGVETATLVLEPLPLPPIVHEPQTDDHVAPRRTTSAGRRAARRRAPMPLPGAPVLIGIAVLAVSAGGALQAMRPDAQAAAEQQLAIASSVSGGSGGGAAGSPSLLGNRTPVVSRSSDRLQATADAQAKQRAEALSGIASKAQQQSHKIQLHAWVLPVQEGVYHLTARFGDYSYLWANFHTGLDFAAPTGTPIMAVAAGEIIETGYSGAYGNRTIERLADGTELWYCHQNEFGTQVGAKVRPGQVIGYVGSTGNVTGPHLHLEVHPHGGDAVDPYPVLVAHGLYPGPPS